MKLTTIFSITLQLLAITPILGCLETLGIVVENSYLGAAFTIDNGLVTCNSNWGSQFNDEGWVRMRGVKKCKRGDEVSREREGGLSRLKVSGLLQGMWQWIKVSMKVDG
jgi:hypothetical protein